MSSTSQKHRNFVSEPMGDKLVTELAGIGPVLGARLTDEGFDKVIAMYSKLIRKLSIQNTTFSLKVTLEAREP